MVSRQDIMKMVKQAVTQYQPDATVILFGSYARGDQRKDSDVDLLVLLNKDVVDMTDTQSIEAPLYDVELQTGIIISPLVYSKKEWADHKVTPYYENVNREGIVL
jgi:predicted nucleotidyltransferase